MKEIERKLISELLKNSRRSDRDLAKAIGRSQPTITRARQKLEKEGYIKEYTMMPDFVKLGYEIMAITCLKIDEIKMVELHKAITEYFATEPDVIMVSGGAQGMGKNGVIISLHKRYSDFSKFITNHMAQWGDNIEDYFSILISLEERTVKPLSLKYIAQSIMSSHQ